MTDEKKNGGDGPAKHILQPWSTLAQGYPPTIAILGVGKQPRQSNHPHIVRSSRPKVSVRAR
jgi:hypothetical protein